MSPGGAAQSDAQRRLVSPLRGSCVSRSRIPRVALPSVAYPWLRMCHPFGVQGNGGRQGPGHGLAPCAPKVRDKCSHGLEPVEADDLTRMSPGGVTGDAAACRPCGAHVFPGGAVHGWRSLWSLTRGYACVTPSGCRATAGASRRGALAVPALLHHPDGPIPLEPRLARLFPIQVRQ